MVDIIIFNNRKHAAQVSHNTCLSAVMDIAAPYYMGTNGFFCPALALRLANGIAFCLCSGLGMPDGPFVVIFRLQIFAQRDAAASGMGDIAVLNNPSFGPVGAYHAFLISCRRGPLRCSFGNGEAG